MAEPDPSVYKITAAASALQVDSAAHVERANQDSATNLDDAAKDLAIRPAASALEVPLSRPIALSSPVEINGNSKIWDITAKFTAASSVLKIGQLVKDETFTLFESVGALEIMDPKMDSGFLQSGETLDDDYDALRVLLPEEVIGIMDQLLCYEMAWHQGYPLSQTLFTSMYIDKLLWPETKSLKDAQFYRGPRPMGFSPLLDILRAYCVGLLKSCDLIIDKVSSRDYFEEEDFSTHTYNRGMLHGIELAEVHQVLRDSMKWVSETSKAGEIYRISPELEEALRVRLKLRELILVATSMLPDADNMKDTWENVLVELPHVELTHPLGRPVLDAFSTKLQRHLASTVPPRPIVKLSFEDSSGKLKELCKDCAEAVRVIDVPESPGEFLSFFWTFASRKPAPLAYARACLSSVFLSRSNEAFEFLIHQDLAELILPADPIIDPVNWTVEAPRSALVPKDKRLVMAEIMNDFTSKALPYYYEIWNCLCQNPSRTRRMLCNNIQFIDGLQILSEQLDEELYMLEADIRCPLSRWVYHLKLRCIEWIIQLGFEQDIYLPDELSGMYWWLQEVSSVRSALLEHILTDLQDILVELEQDESKHANRIAKINNTLDHVKVLSLEARGIEAFAEALHMLYTRLHYYNLIPTPSRPYSDPSLRYELRMKPFLRITPPQTPTFEEYQKAVQPIGPWDKPTEQLTELWSEAIDPEDAIKDAKDKWSALKKAGVAAAKGKTVENAWSKNLASILQSCIACSLALSSFTSLARGKDAESMKGLVKLEIPEPGKRYHDWWAVPRITSK